MIKNVGNSDRYIRFLVGMAFLVNSIIMDASRVGMFFLVLLGVILVMTSITGYCPAYVPLKLCTVGPNCPCCSEAESKTE